MKNQSAAVGRRLSDPEFSQKLLRRSFLTNTVQGGAILALVGDRIWRDHHPPRPHYFYTNGRDTPREVFKAYSPYLIIIAVFSIAQLGPIKTALEKKPFTYEFDWPGLDITNGDGEALMSRRAR